MKKLFLALLGALSIAANAQTFQVNNLNVAGTGTFAARPTFAGNMPYDSGNLSIANYLTTANAASTYAPIASPVFTGYPVVPGYAATVNNLSDLASATTARSNLGLGSLATQSAASVAITGGSISGISVGGSLSGALPNPTIAAGVVTSANLASGAAASNVGSLGGDLTGSLPNPVVNRIGGLGTDRILAQSAVPASVTGTTTETVLATIPIPAGALGINGALRITSQWSATNNADSKQGTVRLGGAQAHFFQSVSFASLQTQVNIRNRGSAALQVINAAGSGSFGTTTSAVTTLAVNTAIAQNLTITGIVNTPTDTLTLEGYTVELLNP